MTLRVVVFSVRVSGALFLVFVLGAAGCTAIGQEGPEADAPAPTSIDVVVHQIYDTSEAAYVEGAYSFIRVEEEDGTQIAQARLKDLGKLNGARFLSWVRLRVPEGRYRFTSFQRACGGSCRQLDPPSEECAADADIEASRPVAVTVVLRVPQPCTIEVGRPVEQRAALIAAAHVRKTAFRRFQADGINSVSCTSARVHRRPSRCRVWFSSSKYPVGGCSAVYSLSRDDDRVRIRNLDLKCLL